MEARSLLLHFNTSSHPVRVKFFPSSSREDLLSGIRELLAVEPNAPLRFRDTDGDFVLLSPGMPSGTVLHVTVEQGIPFQGLFVVPQPNAAAVDSSWCRWERADSGSISANGLRFENQDHTTSWSVYTPRLPCQGQHYFVIHFPKRPCCTALGPIPATMASVPLNTHLIGDMRFPFLVSVAGVGRGPEGAAYTGSEQSPGLDVGVFIDMDRRMVVLVPHEDPRSATAAIRMDDVPVPMVFVLTSPKHGITATIKAADVPEGGVFSGDVAKYVKQPAASTSD